MRLLVRDAEDRALCLFNVEQCYVVDHAVHALVIVAGGTVGITVADVDEDILYHFMEKGFVDLSDKTFTWEDD